ncbi:hypothetical protein, partial [Parasutterella excrementihominis]|uniref:hypothetical protein n=1 Tax=Parasutterella excrementihominis TaxID=487175 RepID=UPI003AB69625
AVTEPVRSFFFIVPYPKEKREILHRRYSTLTLEPEKLKFIDRMVAEKKTRTSSSRRPPPGRFFCTQTNIWTTT